MKEAPNQPSSRPWIRHTSCTDEALNPTALAMDQWLISLEDILGISAVTRSTISATKGEMR